MNRRSFLGALAASSVPVSVAAALSPAERLEAAFREMEEAIRAYDPTIGRLDIIRNEEDTGSKQCRYMVLAYNWA